MEIHTAKARQIFNSRGEKTIEVSINDWPGGAAPAGASTGSNEAVAFPKTVKDAIMLFNESIAPKLIGTDFNKFEDLEAVEAMLGEFDSTERKEKIGASLVIALEYALLRALTLTTKIPLWKIINPTATQIPRPLGNCIGGGAHAGKNSSDIQEFLLISLESERFVDALEANLEVHRRVKKILEDKDPCFTGGKSDEGAWTCTLTNYEILDILSKVTAEVSDELGFKIGLGLDLAASELWDGEHYVYHHFMAEQKEKKLTREEQIDFIIDLIEKYDLMYVEDPVKEDDFEAFAEIRDRTEKCLICGDDLTCTNPRLLQEAIDKKSISAVIIKPNQIGSLIKTKQAVDIAKQNKLVPILSHRSGETANNIIAHLAVAFTCSVIKTGIVGGERTIKLNELIRIQEELKEK